MATPDWLKEYESAATPQPTLKEREAASDLRKKAADVERVETLTPIEERKGLAQAIQAEAEVEKIGREAEAAEKAKTAAKRQGINDIRNLLYNVQQAKENIGFWSMGLPGQLTRGVSGTPVRDLIASLKGVKAPIVLEKLREAKSQSQTGASGFGALSERELGLLESAIASVDEGQSAEQLMENLNRVEYHFRRFQAYNSGFDPDTPEGAYAAGLITPEEDTGAAGRGDLTAEQQVETDPTLAGVNATINRMIKAGRSEEQIREWMNSVQPGLGDRALNIAENINFWQQGGEPKVNVEEQLVPAEGLGAAIGSALMTDPGAVAAGFGSGYTSGTIDELTGRQAQSQAVMDYLREQSPFLYGAGEMGGQIAQYATGAKFMAPLLAKYGIKASSLVADALQSAAYGAGTAQPGERGAGAFSGAVTGTLGGAATRRVTRGAGRLIEGVRDPSARTLTEAGVPMTVGQIVGGNVKRAEDRLTSVPIVGGAINKRRQEGYAGFNKAAFDEALKPLGAAVDDIGEAGVAKAQQIVSDAYRQALDGVVLQADQNFDDAVNAAALPEILKIPRVGDELAGQVRDTLQTYFSGGQISGDMFQTALQELRGLRQSYRNDPQFGSRIGPRLAKVEEAMHDLIRRQAPDRAEMFGNANEAYKRVGIVGEAVEYAPASSGGVFTPAQLRAKSRQVTRTYGGKRASQRGDRPFFELEKAGREALPSSVPDSGTAGRLLLPLGIAGGVGTGQYVGSYATAKEGEEPDLAGPATTAALAAALAAAPYSKASQRMLQKTLVAERPQFVQSMGRGLGASEDYLSAALRPYFAGLGVDTVPSPEPSLDELTNRYRTGEY